MCCVERECRRANRYVFSTFRIRRAVPDPLTAGRENGLARPDVDTAFLILDPQHPFEHNRILVEIRSLAGLEPAGRAPHVCDAKAAGLRIHAPDVLVNELRFRAGGGHAGGFRNEDGGHSRSSSLARNHSPGFWHL